MQPTPGLSYHRRTHVAAYAEWSVLLLIGAQPMTVPQPAAQSRRIWLRALVAVLVLAVVAGGAGGAWLLAHNGGATPPRPAPPRPAGDPPGTGAGGPGYRFGDENLPVGHQPTYPRGTLAMANSGPDSNGSQFFLVYKDSALDPTYTVFGQVVQGIEVLDAIAAAGADN